MSVKAEFKVNEYLTLRLEGEETVIYVSGKRFKLCKYLFLIFEGSSRGLANMDESIDEAAERFSNRLEGREVTPDDLGLTGGQIYWGHCSNLQAWHEHDYDPRLLHSNLSFPLLEKLAQAGDERAKLRLAYEVQQRWVKGTEATREFLIQGEYLHYLSRDKLAEVYDEVLCERDAAVLKRLFEDLDLNPYSMWAPTGKTLGEAMERWERIHSFPDEELLTENGRVVHLYADLKNLEIFPDLLLELTGLKILEIPNSPRVPEAITRLEKLELLSIGSDEDVSAVGGLERLKGLAVGGKDRNSLPASFSNLKNLEHLSFGDKFEEVPECIRYMKKLKYLSMGGREITELPDFLFGLKELRVLNVGNKRLAELPPDVSKLKNLTQLIISGNCLEELPTELRSLPLEYLDVARNPLKEFPAFLLEIPTLKILLNDKNLKGYPERVDGFEIRESGIERKKKQR